MIKSERINSVNAAHFSLAWELYLASFPHEERRDLDYQECTMLNSLYHFDVLTENDTFVGFVLWWEFENIAYIEHLATLPELRGKGIGKKVIEKFITNAGEKIILLEVENPLEEIQQRRINFYQRLGFKLNLHAYKQPAYHIGEDDVELLIMTYPNEISERELANFVQNYHPIIHAETYNKK